MQQEVRLFTRLPFLVARRLDNNDFPFLCSGLKYGSLIIASSATPFRPPVELSTPMLSICAARDAFCRIYENGEWSNSADNILWKLEFHPLSISLLSTVAPQNVWSFDPPTGGGGWKAHQMAPLCQQLGASGNLRVMYAGPKLCHGPLRLDIGNGRAGAFPITCRVRHYYSVLTNLNT